MYLKKKSFPLLYHWGEEICLFQRWSARCPVKWNIRCRRSGALASGSCIWRFGSPGIPCGTHLWTGPFYKVTRNTSRRRKRILAEFRINVNLLLPSPFIERFRLKYGQEIYGFERFKYSRKKIPACLSSRRYNVRRERKNCTIFSPCQIN